MVRRKLEEATTARASRARLPAGALVTPEDEVEQLLCDELPADLAVAEVDAATIVRMCRRLGHAANDAGDFTAAQHWFDCGFVTSRSPADLLSAANMRAKHNAGSTAAEALYLLVSADDSADEHQRAASARKLTQLYQARAAAGVPTASEGTSHGVATTLPSQSQLAGERAWMAATALCPVQLDGVDCDRRISNSEDR